MNRTLLLGLVCTVVGLVAYGKYTEPPDTSLKLIRVGERDYDLYSPEKGRVIMSITLPINEE